MVSLIFSTLIFLISLADKLFNKFFISSLYSGFIFLFWISSIKLLKESSDLFFVSLVSILTLFLPADSLLGRSIELLKGDVVGVKGWYVFLLSFNEFESLDEVEREDGVGNTLVDSVVFEALVEVVLVVFLSTDLVLFSFDEFSAFFCLSLSSFFCFISFLVFSSSWIAWCFFKSCGRLKAR